MALDWLRRKRGGGGGAPASTDAASPHDHLAEGLAAHQAGDLATAEACYRRHLSSYGDDARALHLLGVLMAQRGQIDEARDRIERAVKLDAGNPAMLVDLGNVRMLLGQASAAIDAYREATAIDPGHAIAWGNLAGALVSQGDADAAIHACRKGLASKPDDPGTLVGLAATLRACGARDVAESACRDALALAPGHADALALLGHLLLDRAQVTDALECYRSLVDGQPDHPLAHTWLGTALERAGEGDAAIAACEKGAELAPSHPEVHAGLAGVLWRMRRLDPAVEAFRKALALDPTSLEARANLAALLENMSRLDEAAEEATAGLAHHPEDPYLNLVAAQCARRSGDRDAALRRLEGIALTRAPLDLRVRIRHELGQLHDLLGNPARAFEAFRAANADAAASPQAHTVSKERYLEEIAAARVMVPRLAGIADGAGAADSRESPVFVVGFPRSGTTLVDQILDSHPGARTLSEKPIVDHIVQRIADMADGYPAALSSVSPEHIETLRAEYLAEAARLVQVGPGELLVDRYALNVVRLPAIWRLFPHARIVFALRHPCDVVLSCYMQHFSANDAMASFLDLEDAARLYDAVMALWRTCTESLELDVHVLRYESLIGDFEAELGALLDFLGLPWDERVLDFAQHARARGDINTPSYHQVTRGIYTDSRERWQRYAKPMEPVLPVLAPWVEYFGYAPADVRHNNARA